MFKLIQEILLSVIFGALGASIFIFLTQKPMPNIGMIDTVAIIEPIKRQMINSILDQTDNTENHDRLKQTTEKLNEIIAELGDRGITLIEKKAIVTEGLIHDYTKEIQGRMGR